MPVCRRGCLLGRTSLTRTSRDATGVGTNSVSMATVRKSVTSCLRSVIGRLDCGVLGTLPHPLQQFEGLTFHLLCHVRVDLLQFVGHVVLQTLGRRDRQDQVVGQPSLVTVPQPVEAQPGPYRDQTSPRRRAGLTRRQPRSRASPTLPGPNRTRTTSGRSPAARHELVGRQRPRYHRRSEVMR